MLKYLIHIFLILFSLSLSAQEGLKPLTANINYLYGDLKVRSNKETTVTYQNKAASLSLPFKDDFHYSSWSTYPQQSLWSDSSTYVNCGGAIAPWSIGVATFDGLNKYGYPYTPNNLADMTVPLPADTLTSKPINLDFLQLSDSVVLTFYYQARGNGDAPEISDSLLLDFYKPLTNKWVRVWYQRGNTSTNTNDTIFKRGFVKLDSLSYLHDGFKFRFRNKATTSGDFDHWNLDYVYLDLGRNNAFIADTLSPDFAFGYVPTPLLKNYASMPWKQYDTTDMADNNSVFIRNNGIDANNNSLNYQSTFYDNSNTNVHTYVGGSYSNLGFFKQQGWLVKQSISNPSYTGTLIPTNYYRFPSMTAPSHFKIKNVISNSNTDFFRDNDTIIQHQDFNNYYAYDDGSAEAGYYILGVGGKMAAKFTTRVSDTLRAVRIYFDPVGNLSNAQNNKFTLIIWNVGTGGAPGTIFYADTIDKSVKYYPKCGFNCFSEYPLTNTSLILPPGTYFVGLQQKVATGIVVGFDKNLNHSSNLYYNSGNNWTQSSIYGSLMLRPVFGTDAPVGIKENTSSKNNPFSIYPNPGNDHFIIQTEQTEKASYTLINALGQKVSEGKIETQQQIVNTENLNSGIYFLIFKINDQ
ncbi:MAG: T9SS type A sorting domain-containing protein, partial [Bacteroidia bacterium]